MRSPQIVRLQQQFLASLHDKPRPWLIDQIIPAPGFENAEEILKIYLYRAKARTVDPLNSIYNCLRWLIGEAALHQLIDKFYADSMGEPLNSQTMATEFGAFIGNLSQEEMTKATSDIDDKSGSETDLCTAMVSAALLDWRCHWVSMIEHRSEENTAVLHKKLLHRSSMWLRPRMNKTTRLCTSGIALDIFWNKAQADSSDKSIPHCTDGPQTFLIHADQTHKPVVRGLNNDEDHLLNHCDGTHTIASLCHEAKFYGRSKEQTFELIRQLIDEGVIRNLDDLLI